MLPHEFYTCSTTFTDNFYRNSRDDKLDCFSPLVKSDIIKVGDVITYKRRFVQIGVTIEKDALVCLVSYTVKLLQLTFG